MIRLDTLRWQRQLVAAIAASAVATAAAPYGAIAQPAPAGPSGDAGPPPAAPSDAAAPAQALGAATQPTAAQAAVRAAPVDPALEARLDKAIAARKAGSFDVALEILRGLLADAPQLARAWHEIGVLYALHGQLDEARAASRRRCSMSRD